MRRLVLAVLSLLLVASPAVAGKSQDTMKACAAAWKAMSPADQAKTTYIEEWWTNADDGECANDTSAADEGLCREVGCDEEGGHDRRADLSAVLEDLPQGHLTAVVHKV